MSQEDKKNTSNKKLLNLLLELNSRLINISKKVDNLCSTEDVYLNLESESPIIISEELYIRICDELGEESLRFMGVS